jgi:surface antigen
MQIKSGLVALSVIATLALPGGNTAYAKSETTAKKASTTVAAAQKPAPAPAPTPVMVDVQLGDTLSSIADSHQTSYVRIFDANDFIANPDVIDVGQKVRIPDPSETLPDRVLPAAPEVQAAVSNAVSGSAVQSGISQSARGSVAGNSYAWGNCTWYVKNMRPDLPNNLGNGGQWVASARAMGLATGSTPQVGAVAEQAGHVAYVEGVSGNMVSISEMNYAGGLGQVHRRTVPASTFSGYIY